MALIQCPNCGKEISDKRRAASIAAVYFLEKQRKHVPNAEMN